MQNRISILESLFELQSDLYDAYDAGVFTPDLQVKINRCELYIHCLCNSMPLHFMLCRKIKRAWNNVLSTINNNQPVVGGYTLATVNNKKAAATNQAIEALICAVAGK